jgi:hypothetical protein
MMEYMDNYWKEFDWNNNVFIWCWASTCKKKFSEAMTM